VGRRPGPAVVAVGSKSRGVAGGPTAPGSLSGAAGESVARHAGRGPSPRSPDPRCRCGIYAMWEPWEIDAVRTPPTFQLVLGRVEGWGRVVWADAGGAPPWPGRSSCMQTPPGAGPWDHSLAARPRVGDPAGGHGLFVARWWSRTIRRLRRLRRERESDETTKYGPSVRGEQRWGSRLSTNSASKFAVR
jgi:hypothetical protein